MAKLSTTKRGYGANHQALRERLRPQVEAGLTTCALCGEPIQAGDEWDLGHMDGSNRTVFSGPEHRRCNRATSTHRVWRVSQRW
jgi:hypothetical protein